MLQLYMYWENDGTEAKALQYPSDISIVRLPDMKDAVNTWLDLVHCGITSERRDEAYFEKSMLNHFDYDPKQCFFILVNGEAAATISVFCNSETKDGYIHMVACKEKFRGRGIGTLMCDIANKELKDKGMMTAYLKTDDFRIPAIKSYLRAGFVPDESTDDYKARWAAIREVIAGNKPL